MYVTTHPSHLLEILLWFGHCQSGAITIPRRSPQAYIQKAIVLHCYNHCKVACSPEFPQNWVLGLLQLFSVLIIHCCERVPYLSCV